MKKRSEWITAVVPITFFTVSIDQDTRQRIWRRTTGTNIRFLTQVETLPKVVSFICLFTNANASTGWFIETLLTVRSVSARKKWYYFGSHGVANLKIGAKWETAEVVVGPIGKLAACQIHRKRTGIVHDSISVSRPFCVPLLDHQVKTGYFVCKSSNPSLCGCHSFFSVYFESDEKQSSFSNASKYLDSSFRFDLMHDASSRLYRLRILVCGLNFHGDYLVLFVEAYSPRSRRNLVIFCLVVSTLKCRLLNVLLVIFIEKLIESRI